MIRPMLLPAADVRNIAALRKTAHLAGVRHNRKTHTPVPLPCPWRRDNTYPVQTATDEDPRLFIAITSAARTTLADLTFSDARHLGHRTTDEMRHVWLLEHDNAYTETDPTQSTGRWAHHVSRPTWLVTFQVVEAPRYLGARTDYTYDPNQAARDEPETVDDTLLDKYARDAQIAKALGEHAKLAQLRTDLQRALTSAEQFADIDHLKARPVIKRIRTQLTALDRQLKTAA